MRAEALVLLAAALAACGGQKPAAEAPVAAPSRLASTEGFATPESALWDAELQSWFVSNIDGVPSAKDGNGFLSRLRADGGIDSLRFVLGGRDGAVLHAPKGLARTGDTLWAADIDAVRGFDRRSGAPLATIEVPGAVFLNDVAVGPDGALYVTDTGIRIGADGITHPGPDRVFRVRAGAKPEVMLEGDRLERPNGITWDAAAGRFLLVPFGGADLMSWAPGDSLRMVAKGPGQQDGVERLADGRMLVTSWADSSVVALDAAGAVTRVLGGIPSPADLGVDPVRGIVAVPVFTGNRVEFWRVP
ncbi:MAG: SMP-30/gluconolactonase/LRE family protein [Gemmatimonadales bacterium]|nr:SMP-30/gluconolactonase/LRE family protein [Gemmatimonadales bacterium]